MKFKTSSNLTNYERCKTRIYCIAAYIFFEEDNKIDIICKANINISYCKKIANNYLQVKYYFSPLIYLWNK